MMKTQDDFTGHVNLGNPGEFTILELAKKILQLTGSNSEIIFKQTLDDDLNQRRPDIRLAKKEAGLLLKISLV